MELRILRPFGVYDVGRRIKTEGGIGDRLISLGVAERIGDEQPPPAATGEPIASGEASAVEGSAAEPVTSTAIAERQASERGGRSGRGGRKR